MNNERRDEEGEKIGEWKRRRKEEEKMEGRMAKKVNLGRGGKGGRR